MKRVFTWVKPTAEQLHIWNYFGAIKPIVDMQANPDYEMIVFIPNMHALTSVNEWIKLKLNTYNVLRSYIWLWLDPKKVTFFLQSEISAHAELNRVFSCITTLWYMKRMHAFKDAFDKWKIDDTNMGTVNYPILMAADILLYDADVVPVWKDQKQHLEFSRDIWAKFNNIYGETFKIPEPLIIENVATVPGIDWRKMSKSYNNFLWVFEDEATLLKKIKSITTDAIAIEEPKDPDKCNVYNILKLFITKDEDIAIRKRYTDWGLSYKDAKMYLYEKMIQTLKPIQEKAKAITEEEIKILLTQWREKANSIATNKIKQVYDKIGFNI